MKMKPQMALASFLLLWLLVSCDSGPGGGEFSQDPSPALTILSPTQLSETGFQVNWSIEDPFGFQSIAVQVATDEDLSNSVSYVQIDDISTDHLLLENLHGATKYYYKISLLNNGSAVVESDIKSAETAYKIVSIELHTEDDFTLAGKLAYLETLPGKRPGIILMHEYGVWVNPWVGSPLLRELVGEGYICLTFFFRGHGSSTPMDDLMELINDKSLLASDLQSAREFLNAHELSTGKLGLIGGSMGAIMALAGNGYEEVLSSVALSPTRDGVFSIFSDMTLKSVYYLVGELDISINPELEFPAEAYALFDLTEEPRKIDLIPGTADHGSSLLERDSLVSSVEAWFLETLPLE
jgi:dienelactone hydrolase